MNRTRAKIVGAVLGVMGVLGGEAALRAVTPTAWPGCAGSWQMKRHTAKKAEIAAGGAPVVFIGDSITHYWESRGKAAWTAAFGSGPRRALNLGTSGDRTEHVLWRLTAGGELDGYEAACIVLMIGTNNTGHFPLEKESPADTVQGIRRILQVIAEKQPRARTILTAVFPRGAGADDARRRRNDAVNREIRKFADGRRVVWCDLAGKFLSKDGTLSKTIFPDRLHPNARGYAIWAEAVAPLVDRVLAAKPGEIVDPLVFPAPAVTRAGK